MFYGTSSQTLSIYYRLSSNVFVFNFDCAFFSKKKSILSCNGWCIFLPIIQSELQMRLLFGCPVHRCGSVVDRDF